MTRLLAVILLVGCGGGSAEKPPTGPRTHVEITFEYNNPEEGAIEDIHPTDVKVEQK